MQFQHEHYYKIKRDVLFHHKAYYYEQPNLIVSDIQHTEDFDALGTSWQTGKDL